MHGLDWYDFHARQYGPVLSRFHTVDPLAEKYYSISPYAYCANNPIKFIDPTGMQLENKQQNSKLINNQSRIVVSTKYIDDKGNTLYTTNDGLNDIIIIPDRNLKLFKDNLNELSEQDLLDDPTSNIDQLHALGTEITKYKNDYKTGNKLLDSGYIIGYPIGYNDESHIWMMIWMHIQGVSDEGAKILGGYYNGKYSGKSDRKSGKINKLDPYKSLKKNKPLIKLKKNNNKDKNE